MVLSEYDEQKHIENEKNWSREEGIRIGKEQGMKLGKEQGMKLGKEQGMKQINALTTILLRERRLEELERCLQDAEYQQQQLREYHLL